MQAEQNVLCTKVVPKIDRYLEFHWKFPISFLKVLKWYLNISSYTTEYKLEFPEKSSPFIGIPNKLNLKIKIGKTQFNYPRGN